MGRPRKHDGPTWRRERKQRRRAIDAVEAYTRAALEISAACDARERSELHARAHVAYECRAACSFIADVIGAHVLPELEARLFRWPRDAGQLGSWLVVTGGDHDHPFALLHMPEAARMVVQLGACVDDLGAWRTWRARVVLPCQGLARLAPGPRLRIRRRQPLW